MARVDGQGSQLEFVLAMGIFGTIGLFRRWIPLPSDVVALMRGVIGVAFLLLLLCISKRHLDRQAIRRNAGRLIMSGAMIGFNWILLFESYRYTTVATATLCYYLAPVFVMLASPFVLGEQLTKKKGICAVVAIAGMVLVSGVVSQGIPSRSEGMGIVCGIGAALFYASVILMNQKMREIPSYDMTIIQLSAATAVLLPYTVITEQGLPVAETGKVWILLIVIGVVHTGVAYTLYFHSMKKIPAQTIAILSYLDPVIAILLSALVLREEISVFGWIGAGMILGATAVSAIVVPQSQRK